MLWNTDYTLDENLMDDLRHTHEVPGYVSNTGDFLTQRLSGPKKKANYTEFER